MSNLNGSWALTSSENFEAYIEAIGVSGENREKALKLLLSTGDGGLVEKFEIDDSSAKRSIYFGEKLFKESPKIPLNEEFEGPALDERIVKATVTTDGPNRLTRVEKGPDYQSTVVAEIHGSELVVTLTTDSGVQSIRKYKKV